MLKTILKSLLFIFIILSFQACFVGKVVSAPFKVAGAVVNTVTPDIVGDTISTTGDVVDAVIPF